MRITGPEQPTALSPAAVLGNAGTAMRRRTAALALLGGELNCVAYRACTSARSATWSMHCANWVCRIDYLGNEGYPRCIAHGAGLPALHDPIRAATSSHFLTGLLLSAAAGGRQQDVVIEVVGELISKPYIQITLELMRASASRCKTRDGSAGTIPRAAATSRPGASMSRRT